MDAPDDSHSATLRVASSPSQETAGSKEQHKVSLVNKPDARLLSNPFQYGLPRRFKVVLSTDGVNEQSNLPLPFMTGQSIYIYFAGFGTEDMGLWINDTWVPPSQVQLSTSSMTYTIETSISEKYGGGTVSVSLECVPERLPNGKLVYNSTSTSTYSLQLQPYACEFNISVAAHAGVAWSDGTGSIVWDVNSAAWKGAAWENNAGVFAYDVKSDNDPVLPTSAIEIGITDSKSTPPAVAPKYDFELSLAEWTRDYIVTFVEQADRTNQFMLNVEAPSVIPSASLARASSPVASLFMKDGLFTFDKTGSTFLGGFCHTEGVYYAIKGTVIGMSSVEALFVNPPGDQASVVTPVEAAQAPVHVPTAVGVQSASLQSTALDPLFDAFQPTTDFAAHPVVLMTINYLESQVGGQWSTGLFSSQNNRDTFFPNFKQTSPDLSSICSWDHNKYWNAMVTKSIYSSGYCTDRVDVGSVNNALSDLTNTFFANGAAFYAAYFGYHYGVTASAANAQTYASLLLRSSWRTMRSAEGTQGGWNNASLEMYEHLVKYHACGASDSDVASIYTQLTTTDPKLNASVFADITPATWHTYRAWVGPGSFDGSMMPLANLNAVKFIPAGDTVVTSRPPEEFMNTTSSFEKHDDSGGCQVA